MGCFEMRPAVKTTRARNGHEIPGKRIKRITQPVVWRLLACPKVARYPQYLHRLYEQ